MLAVGGRPEHLARRVRDALIRRAETELKTETEAGDQQQCQQQEHHDNMKNPHHLQGTRHAEAGGDRVEPAFAIEVKILQGVESYNFV